MASDILIPLNTCLRRPGSGARKVLASAQMRIKESPRATARYHGGECGDDLTRAWERWQIVSGDSSVGGETGDGRLRRQAERKLYCTAVKGAWLVNDEPSRLKQP